MTKTIIGLCGPNGSGKSTAFKALQQDRDLSRLPWVNADAILVAMSSGQPLLLADYGLHTVPPEEFNFAAERHSLS